MVLKSNQIIVGSSHKLGAYVDKHMLQAENFYRSKSYRLNVYFYFSPYVARRAPYCTKDTCTK